MKTPLALALVLLLGLTIWWSYGIDSGRPVSPVFDSEDSIDGYMKGVRLTTLNESGGITLTMTADTLEQLSGQQLSRLTTPEITVYQDDANWRIRADRGVLDNEDRSVMLEDNVTLDQTSGSKRVHITTSSLHFDLRQRTADTQQLVNIRTGELDMSSRGMRLDHERNQLSLLSDVRGKYVVD